MCAKHACPTCSRALGGNCAPATNEEVEPLGPPEALAPAPVFFLSARALLLLLLLLLLRAQSVQGVVHNA